jgi:hypothetical protein
MLASGSKHTVLAAVTKTCQRNTRLMVDWNGQVKIAAAKDLWGMGNKAFDFFELRDEEPVHLTD